MSIEGVNSLYREYFTVFHICFSYLTIYRKETPKIVFYCWRSSWRENGEEKSRTPKSWPDRPFWSLYLSFYSWGGPHWSCISRVAISILWDIYFGAWGLQGTFFFFSLFFVNPPNRCIPSSLFFLVLFHHQPKMVGFNGERSVLSSPCPKWRVKGGLSPMTNNIVQIRKVNLSSMTTLEVYNFAYRSVLLKRKILPILINANLWRPLPIPPSNKRSLL